MENRLTIANLKNTAIEEAMIEIDGEKYLFIHRKDIPENAEYGDVFIRDDRTFGLIKLATRDRLRRLLRECGQRSGKD